MCTLVRAPASTLFPYTTLFRSQHHDTFGPGPEPGVWVEFLEGFFFTVFEWDEADEQHHCCGVLPCGVQCDVRIGCRSEEHTSELQSRGHLVCRLLLATKKRPVV